jgi:hypothetical protein
MTCPAPLLNSLWFTILSLILLAYTSRVRVRVRSGGVWGALNCLNCFRSLLEQLKGIFPHARGNEEATMQAHLPQVPHFLQLFVH